jgi:tetratricopeptide (TPR) repeat protein
MTKKTTGTQGRTRKTTQPPHATREASSTTAPPYAFYSLLDMRGATEEEINEMLVAYNTYIKRRTQPKMDDWTRQDLARVYLRRGAAYGMLEQWQAALADLDRVIAADECPDVTNTARLLRAGVHSQTGRSDLAIADSSFVLAVIEQAPAEVAACLVEQRVAALLCRGKLHAIEERFEEALSDLDAALTHGPSNADALCARGLARAYAGHKEEALADCNRALELEQASYCYHRRGVVHTLRWEFEAALADLCKALDLDPQNEQIQTYLAKTRALWRLGRVLGVLLETKPDGGTAQPGGNHAP